MPPLPSVRDSSTVELPLEVLSLIAAQCDTATLKQVRLCKKWLAQESSLYLFATVSFQMRSGDIERVVNIVNSTNKIASVVKVLELHQTPRLPNYRPDEWRKKFRRTWDPENKFDELVDGDQEKLALIQTRDQLFEEYQTQGEELTLHRCMTMTGPSILERMNSAWPQQQDEVHEGGSLEFLRRYQQTCLDFEEAILKLPNLQRFSANFPPRFKWRGKHLYRASDYSPSSLPVEEQVAPLAFVLQALGRRSSSHTSPTSVQLDLREAWWGLHDIEQGLRPEEFDFDWEGRWRCQDLMDAAFTHLTELDMTLELNDNTSGDFETLARLLTTTKKLARLQITITNNEMDDADYADMLSIIKDGTQWPKLEQLEMNNVSFESDSLFCTLSHLAPTLQSLLMENCDLIEEESSWPDFYQRMRLISFSKLSHLRFKDNRCQKKGTFPLGQPILDFSDNDIIDNLLSIHRSSGGVGVGFRSEIYDFILKKTDIMPPLHPYAYNSVEEKLRMQEYIRRSEAAIARIQQERGNTQL